MNKRDEELINHLAEKLKSHELPYKEGAWEKFAAAQKSLPKRNRVLQLLSPWTAAAAAVILAAAAGLYYYNHQGDQSSITNAVTQTALNQTTVAPRNPSFQTPADQPHKDAGAPVLSKTNAQHTGAGDGLALSPTGKDGGGIQQASQNNNIQHLNIGSVQNIQSDAVTNVNLLSGIEKFQPGIRVIPQVNAGSVALTSAGSSGATPNNGQVSGSSQKTNAAGAQKAVAISTQPQVATVRQQDIAAGNFDDKGYIDPDARGAGQNKWDMGLMVLPAMGNDSKLNLGYGVNVGYKLSNRFSLNSGLAYTEMSGSKNVVSADGGLTSGVRTLSSIDANVTGVNLPLELRYNISQKIYVGAGVAALAVITNKQDRNYAINQLQSTAFVSKNGNLLKPQQIEALTSGIQTKEAIPDGQIDSKNFAGFLNFSFGFKQKLHKSKSLSIEPFLSVPMSNNLSNQNIKLTDGGIRIKIGL